MNQRINTFLYILMVSLGVLQYLNSGNLMDCFAILGIALFFDLFDQDLPGKTINSWQ